MKNRYSKRGFSKKQKCLYLKWGASLCSCNLVFRLYRSGYDFKKLFTISEYYDRNRADYYKAIQSVRNNDMDMTQWLEYFSADLAAQLYEIKDLGKQVIKQDVLLKQHQLSARQKLAIEYITKQGGLTIQEFEKICPGVTRRALQRELKDLMNKEIIVSSGATSNLIYLLRS